MVAKINQLSRTLEGKLTVTFEVDCPPEELQDFIGKDLTLTVKKLSRKRSLDANALLWATLGELAQALHTDKDSLYLQMLRDYGKFTYVSIDSAAVEDFRKIYKECEIVGESEDKTFLLCYFGSSTYNKEEFSHLLDGVISEAKGAGVHLKAGTEIEELYAQWQRKSQA